MKYIKLVGSILVIVSLSLNFYYIRKDLNDGKEIRETIFRDNEIAKNSKESNRVIDNDTFRVRPAFRDGTYVNPKLKESVASVESDVQFEIRNDTIIEYIIKVDTVSFDSIDSVLEFGDDYKDESLSYNFQYRIPFSYKDSLVIESIVSTKKKFSLNLEYGFSRLNDTLFVWAYENSPHLNINNLKGFYKLEDSKKIRKPFSVGLSAGYAYLPSENKFGPYVGLGVNFKLFEFGF